MEPRVCTFIQSTAELSYQPGLESVLFSSLATSDTILLVKLGSGDELTLPMRHKLTMEHEKSSPPSFTGFQSQGV